MMEKNPDAKSGESLYRYKILEVQHGKTMQTLTKKVGLSTQKYANKKERES
jgi:hypothetical protein